MGKRIIAQRRGKGSPTYRAPSHRYVGKVTYPRIKEPFKAEVIDIVHDPGRNAPVAIVKLPDGRESLLIATEGLAVGDALSFGEFAAKAVAPLAMIPPGTPICAIEAYPGSGPKFCRSSGSYGVVVSKSEETVIVKMPSGVFKEFDARCLATVGIPAGGGRKDKPFVKAGQKYYAMKARNKLWPRTSPCKMNAVDHPFGGQTGPGQPKTVSRHAPPGAKVGSIAARRTGVRKTGKQKR
jgi:large subunit ribosomal protein L2